MTCENVWTQSRSNIFVVGHRGARALCPENTMPSFEKAVGMGLDGIEMDLNLTRDGRMAVIHDQTLSRTTDGEGAVCDFSMAELKSLDAAAKFPGRTEAARIPEFDEFLELMRGNSMLLNVEIKPPRTDLADLAVAALDRFGMLGRTVMTCFHAGITTYLHKKYGVKTQGFPRHMVIDPAGDTFSHYYAVGVEMGDLSRAYADELLGAGIDPWCWCPDSPEAVGRAIDEGATLMTCNDPRPALKILADKNLRPARGR